MEWANESILQTLTMLDSFINLDGMCLPLIKLLIELLIEDKGSIPLLWYFKNSGSVTNFNFAIES